MNFKTTQDLHQEIIRYLEIPYYKVNREIKTILCEKKLMGTIDFKVSATISNEEVIINVNDYEIMKKLSNKKNPEL